MRKAISVVAFIFVLLFIALAGEQIVTVIKANFLPPQPELPSVYIRSNGSVTPSTLPIQKVGDLYTFTGDILNVTLEIQRSNIIIDGAGHTFQGNASGKGIYIKATNVTIKNLEIRKFVNAVVILEAANNTITHNCITRSERGIVLHEAKYNIVEDNTLSNNTIGILIYSDSDYNQIIGNNITASSDSGIWCERTTPTSDFISIVRNNISDNNRWGVLLRSSYKCNVVENTVSKNKWGIYLSGDSCYDYVIAENNIAFNEEGIRIGSQYITELYHNNFLNNSCHVYKSSVRAMPVHIWDNGGQGNYWSDYQGFDADGDGIGDEPYIIDTDNIDSYPLICPYDIEKGAITLPTPEAHPEPESLSITPVIASASIAIFTCVGLLFYFKKRKL